MHINCQGCEGYVFRSPAWKMLRHFIGEMSGEFCHFRPFSPKYTNPRNLTFINQAFIHFISRKDFEEQLTLKIRNENENETDYLHKVDDYSRAFLEQLESWRTESAVMWAMEVEGEDEA